MTTRELLLSAWDRDPLAPLLGMIAVVAYGAVYQGRITKTALYFLSGVAISLLALSSPIGVLARGYLFSAHMLQHLLLLLVVPPLVLLGLPPGREAASPRESRLGTTKVATRRYALPWMCGVSAMWIWHEPAICNAAATSESVGWLQTVSLVVMGLVFWWPVVAPRLQARYAPFAAMLYLFAACVGCSILGILLTFSPIEVCTRYLRPADELGVLPLLRDGWGLSPRVDQQVGGLMMWVPACLIYATAILTTLARYYREEGPSPAPLGRQAIRSVPK